LHTSLALSANAPRVSPTDLLRRLRGAKTLNSLLDDFGDREDVLSTLSGNIPWPQQNRSRGLQWAAEPYGSGRTSFASGVPGKARSSRQRRRCSGDSVIAHWRSTISAEISPRSHRSRSFSTLQLQISAAGFKLVTARAGPRSETGSINFASARSTRARSAAICASISR
jgi:hypothetical protein